MLSPDSRSIPVRSDEPAPRGHRAAADGFLSRATTALAAAVDVEEALAAVARAAVPEFADWCAVDIRDGTAGDLRRVAMEHEDPAKVAQAVEMQRRWPTDPSAQVGAHAVVRSGEPLLLKHVARETLREVARDEDHLRTIENLGVCSLMIVPIPSASGPSGALTFALAREEGERYDDDALAVAEELARRVALAVDRAHLYVASRASQERLRALVDSVDGIVWEADLVTHRFTFVSQQAERILGHPVQQWLTEDDFWGSHLVAADAGWARRQRATQAAEGREHELEYRMRAADGGVVWILDRVFIERDANGQPSLLRGIMLDVTQRKTSEQRFAAQHEVTTILSEARSLSDIGEDILRALGSHLGWDVGALWRIEPDGRKLACEATWTAPGVEADAFLTATRRTSLRTDEGLPGRVWAGGRAECIPLLATDKNFPRAKSAAAVGLRSAFALPIQSRAGPLGVIELYARDERAVDEMLLGFADHLGWQMGQFLERRAAEEQARLESERRSAVLGASLDAIVTIDHEGRVREWNPAAQTTFGYTREEALTQRLSTLIVPKRLRAAHERGLMRAVKTGQADLLGQRREMPAIRKDGTEFITELAILHVPGTQPPLYTGFLRDVTERHRSTQSLRFQAALLEAQMDAMPVGILVLSPGGEVISYNSRFCEMWGIDEDALVDAGAEQVIELMRPHLVDSAAVEARTRALSGDSETGAHDELRLVDERILERHGSPVNGEDGTFYGRIWTFRDVTQERQTQVQLSDLLLEVEQQRHRLDSIVKSVPGVVWETWVRPDEARQRIDFVSEHVEKMLGYTSQEWLSEPDFWLKIVHPEDRARSARESAAIFERGGSGSVEFRWITKGGRALHVVANSVVIRDEEGNAIGMRGVTLDVSEHKRVIEAAHRSEERFHLMARATNDVLWDWDVEADALWWNDNFYDTFGYSVPEVEPGIESWTSRIHPDDVQDAHGSLQEVLDRGGDTWAGEYRFRRRDGKYLNVLDRAFVARDADGRARRVIGSMMDVTARHEAESALRDSEERYRFMADVVPQQVWTSGPDGRLDYVNARVTEYFGRHAEKMIGEGWQAVVHEDDIERVVELWTRSLETGEPYEVEFRLRRHDGQYRWHIGRALPLRDATGQIVKWFGANADIMDHKDTQVQLQQRALELAALAAALERSNRELDQFAYVTSHDLKAPLRGIANLASWIEEDLGDAVDDGARRHLDLLRGRVHRMESLIDAILQYSRVGRIHARPEPVNVAHLLAETVDLASLPEGFRVNVVGKMPELTAERAPLQQVFLNLIGNAAKHHHEPSKGSARICVEDAGDFWRFIVQDDGPGIAPRFHERVFVIFQTLEARDKVEGTGVGLALVKKIVQTQGGTIVLESAEGQGATLRFTWPKTPPADAGDDPT